MGTKQCTASLSTREAETLAQATEQRLYACAACRKRNLYPVRSPSGDWVLEPHYVPGALRSDPGFS
jgi:hypothetical protein